VDRSIAAVGYVNRIGGGIVGNALRLIEPADSAQELARSKIDHAQAIITKLGDEQPLAGEVDREMIDPSPHLAERDLALQRERLCWAGNGRPHRVR
jgi:hypothetical protein